MEESKQYSEIPPYISLINNATSIYGITKAICAPGIDLLNKMLSDEVAFTARLIVVVYPTCKTKETDLLQLLEMVKKYNEKLHLRIYPANSVFCAPVNTLCIHSKSDGEIHVSLGNSNLFTNCPFLFSEETPTNFLFQPDPVLLESYNNYFNWFWSQAKDITHPGVARIPSLVLPKGSEEGYQIWQNYCSNFLENSTDDPSERETTKVDPETGAVTITDKQGDKIATPTEELGISELDQTAVCVARLYSKGLLVSIDKLSRIPPLDAPLDPEIFGDRAKIASGAISRSVRMRVSVIDKETLKDLEKCRKSIRPLINNFSYGLAENMRWIPKEVQPLFASELERINKEGQQLIGDLFNGDVDAFLQGKRAALTKDVKNLLGELGNQKEVTENQIELMMAGLKSRLEKAITGDFIPKLSYSKIVFDSSEQSHIAPWGQAFTLLYNIAIFSRKAICDQYFLNGVNIPDDSYISTMDVFDDAILKEGPILKTRSIAKQQLNIIKKIKCADISSKDRCELIIKILKGAASKEIDDKLIQLTKDKDNDGQKTH